MHGQRLKESTLLQNLLSHHHSKIIDGSYAEEGLQSPRCRPTQPLFRSATFLLNLNMSFTTFTKIVTLLNIIQRIAQKHSSNVHREIRGARVVASLFLHLSPVSPCECLHSHTGYCRPVNYPVKTKGSKQLSGCPAHSTRVPRTYPGTYPVTYRRGNKHPGRHVTPDEQRASTSLLAHPLTLRKEPTWQRTSSGQKPTSAP